MTDLDHGQVLIVEASRGGRVRLLSGSAWLTAEGDSSDTFLCAGSEGLLQRGRTLIEGLAPARVQIAEATTGSRWWPAAGWASLRRGVRRQVARLQLGPEVVELPI
jgi:hypothetical protein